MADVYFPITYNTLLAYSVHGNWYDSSTRATVIGVMEDYNPPGLQNGLHIWAVPNITVPNIRIISIGV
jgi:hypothetical protein